MEKMSKMERAKPFMPFAALHGFEDEIRKQEIIKSPRRELSEEEMLGLNSVITALKKGDLVLATYYTGEGYADMEGAITELDFSLRFIRIVKTRISFDDLSFIRKIK